MPYMALLPHCQIPQPELAALLVRALGEEAEKLQILPLPESQGGWHVNLQLPTAPPPAAEPQKKARKMLRGDEQAAYDEVVHKLVIAHGPVHFHRLSEQVPVEWKAHPKALYRSLKRLIEVGAVKGSGRLRSRIYEAV